MQISQIATKTDKIILMTKKDHKDNEKQINKDKKNKFSNF